MEYCDESLLSMMERTFEQDGYISEDNLKLLVKEILSALAHCHSKNIVHRDLKLENILLKKEEDGWTSKLIDFGLSKIKAPCSYMKRVCGSFQYVAPEVLKQRYNEKCDIWSLGVIIFICLTGHFPFNHKKAKGVFDKILNQKQLFNSHERKTLSKHSRNFVHNLMNRVSNKRVSAK